jgi:pyruvate/2-oxoglutarate dehydrogenase complex dihydrolipoamide acyltransferase (E2) component
MLSTPTINPPQSGILGMHNIIERPIAVNGFTLMYVICLMIIWVDDGVELVVEKKL